MSVISKFDITAIEIAADNLGNIYFTVASQLKMLSTEGDVKLVYEFAPRELSTVHVSVDQYAKYNLHRKTKEYYLLELLSYL
jgi:hypothetical protein